VKAILPNRTFNNLSKPERDRIVNMLEEQENKDIMIILDIFMKMSCDVLHRSFGFGEQRCNMFLGNFKRVFATARKQVKAQTQSEELDRKMSQIFRKHGYPDSFFKQMFDDWDITTGGNNEQSQS